MKKKESKKEVSKRIKDFFLDIKNKSPEQIKKIKRLAMKRRINLKENRKTFCKKCFNPYRTPKIRIKSGIKTVTCENCGYVSRWKVKKN